MTLTMSGSPGSGGRCDTRKYPYFDTIRSCMSSAHDVRGGCQGLPAARVGFNVRWRATHSVHSDGLALIACVHACHARYHVPGLLTDYALPDLP